MSTLPIFARIGVGGGGFLETFFEDSSELVKDMEFYSDDGKKVIFLV